MAKLALKPNEQVLFPQPYVENEHSPLFITTARVIWAGEGKKKEIDASKIQFAGKGFHQKFVKVMLIFGLLALPFLGVGVFKYYTYRNLPMEAPAPIKGVKQKPLTPNDLRTFQNNRNQYIIGIALGVFGALCGGIAYLMYKRRLTVIIAGQGSALNIPAKDAMEQDKILTMVNAAKTAAAAMAPVPLPDKVIKPPGAAAPPKLSK